jgi:hypothetical protein
LTTSPIRWTSGRSPRDRQEFPLILTGQRGQSQANVLNHGIATLLRLVESLTSKIAEGLG